MRLIDADALINTLQELFDKREKEARFTGDRGVTVTWNDAIYHIKAAPTIEERKTGKWIKKGAQMHINLDNAREQYTELGYPHRNISVLMCDVCRKITLVDESIKYNFCPHCGADMRGEGHE